MYSRNCTEKSARKGKRKPGRKKKIAGILQIVRLPDISRFSTMFKKHGKHRTETTLSIYYFVELVSSCQDGDDDAAFAAGHSSQT